MLSKRKALIVAILTVLILGALFAVARATDNDAFCNAACHEMKPYHQAWEKGAHSDVQCVECHVDQGVIPRLLHKWVALGELKVHVFGKPVFPMDSTAKIPDERCIRCHKNVTSKDKTFSHADHAKRGSCEWCHTTTAHNVTPAALKAANVYSGLPISGSAEASGVAIPGKGSANIVDHKEIGCTRCHDMKKTGCAGCHEQPTDHDFGAECASCHTPNNAFAFAHPMGTNCANCHEAPSADHSFKGVCTACHKKPGKSWDFTHPKSGTCATCHTAPAKHSKGACSSCHKQTGRSWEFSHPAGTTCSNCHNRPANHASGACSSCHKRPGQSWAFAHPASNTCANCHKPPSSHFSGGCAGCHSPSRSWSNASFSHSRIRGGEHTYRSFACSKCHPSGYTSYSCRKCHDSATGPTDDD